MMHGVRGSIISNGCICLCFRHAADRTMPLDPMIAQLVAAGAGEPPIDTLPIETVRRAMRARTGQLLPCRAEIAGVRDLAIPAPHGDIPARLYTPVEGDPPLVLFFHGGGWAICDLDTHDNQCRRLCADAGAAVLSIDYRLAPEHPFPAPLDDCVGATRWAARNPALLGADAGRLVLAGDSAGGNIAAAAALALRDSGGPAVCAQLLVYPALAHPSQPSGSYDTFAEGFGLSRRSMAYFWRLYLGEDGVEPPALAAPLRAEDLTRLPPALIVTAEYDVLRDEGERYAERLREAGVETRTMRIESVNHGFLALEAMLPAADAAFREIGTWLRERCGTTGREAA
ncbi:MAG: alpha/beta hydrolase [Sphingomonas sp.]|uniref:alpha/beta hydrolase n=1 Tax=Sphingomonas sp. TaxID=28214 RepID=UPI0025EA75A0|nr:alpha/beta hydrolase [Sphingomonas sp.]MBQ1499159.1 alpha/beta hydrolase [Sphingomonas sp.]